MMNLLNNYHLHYYNYTIIIVFYYSFTLYKQKLIAKNTTYTRQ